MFCSESDFDGLWLTFDYPMALSWKDKQTSFQFLQEKQERPILRCAPNIRFNRSAFRQNFPLWMVLRPKTKLMKPHESYDLLGEDLFRTRLAYQ